MTSFTPVSSPIFPAGSSQPALDAQITKVSPSSSLLTKQPVNVMVNPSPISPNSASPTESIFENSQKNDSSSERSEKATAPEPKSQKKKVRTKSNQYSNKTKAKIHLGACAVGSITLGILAGPLGLVFAAAYINAMCGVMYGGSEFFTGDQTSQAKTEPDPQLKDIPHKTPRNLNVPSSEEGKIPDETDAEREKEQDNKGKDNVFIFAPVINNDNRTTIHGNVYFFNQNDQKNDSSAEPKSSSNFSQTEKETNTTPTMRGARLINRQEARQLISHPSVLNATVENVDDIINQFHGAELIHVDFHDGMNAIVDAPESLRHQILLHQDETGAQTPTSASYNVQGVEDTGVTKNGPLQSNAPQHHRGGDFDALIGAEIAHSQASARLVADELQEKPVIGATGTHRWQQAEQGSWVLQPNNSVQAQTPSAMGGSPQSTPTNAPVSDGMDDATDAQSPILTPDNVKRSDRTSADLKKVTNDRSTFDTENSHINLVPMTGQGGQIISEILPPVTPADLSKKISSSWTRVISEDGQVRWSNSFQSADQLVLLTAGSISGLGGNYTKGTWNNLRDIEEHRKNRLKNLQNNLSSKDYKKFNTLDGKLVWPLQEANLKTA
ncbi:Lipoprotein VsaC [Vibrio cholerae]|nr:Lipoprotein VsaC [Vibrio cholerae]